MDYYAYPLDTKTLLRKKRSIKKELLQQDITWIEKKIAILGGSTTNEIADQLELTLLNHGIKAEIYQSEYGKYWEDGMFGNDVLDSFAPDIVFIHTNWRNIQAFPSLNDTEETVSELLERQFERFLSLWKALRKKFGCVIIQNNFERPDYRLLGNRDIWDYRGRSNFVSRLNLKLYEFAQSQESFFIHDLDFVAQDYGTSEWNDPIYWDLYKYICPMKAIPILAVNVGYIIKSIYGRNKKLLALDLDNTLWGGIVGDDGVEGIKIGTEIPQGRVFHRFQEYCKELKNIGILLAVDSKNEEENALAGIGHPDGPLNKEDFVSIKANWNTKDQNLQEIAEELSLGMDSFVFVDDNPAEREIVRRQHPAVTVPEVENAESFIRVLDHSGFFEVTSLSGEDIKKTEQYRARAQARIAQAEFADYKEYLASLHMKALVTEFEPISIQRIAQLTNKTNQFNLTTLRCSEEDVRKMQENPNCICLCGRLIDKFADNGIVTVVVGEIIKKTLHIRLWLMSCRVLKREMENFMMNRLLKEASARGIQEVYGYYSPTSKNSMVKDFYGEMGFQLVSVNNEGNSIWKLEPGMYIEKKTEIVSGNG